MFTKKIKLNIKNCGSYIKIEREYNKKDRANYSSKSTTEVLEEGYIEKIINTKTVEYKELNYTGSIPDID